ncbi:uncharacterized protein DS421_9g260260 [Arachis hypogaea]|nr:uncharacterized protein DS421_9g260260 [Arachis hypogaea]
MTFLTPTMHSTNVYSTLTSSDIIVTTVPVLVTHDGRSRHQTCNQKLPLVTFPSADPVNLSLKLTLFFLCFLDYNFLEVKMELSLILLVMIRYIPVLPNLM